MKTLLKVLLCAYGTVSLYAGILPVKPERLTDGDWSDIRAAHDANRYAFRPAGTGWQAENPGQQWTSKFDERGFIAEPPGGGWQWGLELRSYGFGEKQRAIGGAPVGKAEGQRLSYQWDATIQEWWVNDGRGLEHGFTVMNRPEGNPNANRRTPEAPLSLTLRTRGTLHPRVAPGGQSVVFQSTAGATVLNYSGLKVWDADGKVLSAHFKPSRGGVQLLIEEHHARYPLTIDPVAQQAYLKPAAVGTTQLDDQFGHAVAVSGDTVVVGAPYENSNTTGMNSTPNETGFNGGAVYVFVRSAGVWTQQAYLKSTPYRHGALFGYAVALSGDTLVVGAINESSSTTGINSTPNNNALQAGAAYIFVRNGTTWTQQAYLKPAAVGINQAYDRFGFAVSISGNTAVIGAPSEDSSRTGVNSTPNDAGNIGPTGTNFYNSGAAYVFVRNGTAWSQQAYLKPAAVGSTQQGDSFGESVSISGDTLVVGAPSEDSNTRGINTTPNDNSTGAGAAYIFVRTGTVWSQQAYLKPAVVGSTQQGDLFGAAVAVSGNTVAVGAYDEDSNSKGVNSTPNETGAINSGGFYHYNAGAVYVFVRNGTTWTQQAYLKPGAFGVTSERDVFGSALALAGDTLVVGSLGEDSSTTGINSTPTEGAENSGAAYIFTRTAGVWVQKAYLKPAAAGATQGSDNFGASVAVSEDGTVVIGSPREDSGTTGLNSTPNESASNAGAAFIVIDTAPEVAVHNGAGTTAPELMDGTTAPIQFPVARQGTPVERDFTIANTGTADLRVTNIVVPSGFSVVNPPAFPLTVTPGNTSAFRIRLNATAPGSFGGIVSITSDDRDEPVFDFPVAGTVITPEITVFNGPGQTSPELTDGQTTPVDFGVARQATATPAARTFTLGNPGSAPLLIESLTLPAGYTALNLPPLPFTIAVNESLALQIQLNADVHGTFAGGIAIASDDLDETLFNFPVTGAVVSPEIAVHDGAAAAPELTDGQAAAVDFGRNVQATPGTRSFTIANTGTAELLLSGVTLPPGYTGLNVPALPLLIGAGQSTTFQINLTTLTVGTHAGSVMIASDDLDEALFDFPLTGEVFIPDPVSSVVSTLTTLNRQTGLRERTIHITNDTTATVPAYNLIIRGLPPGVEVNNASETRADGSVVVYIRQGMSPHSAQDIVIEYYSPNRAPVEISPQLSTEVILNPPDLTVSAGPAGLAIANVTRLTGGEMLLEFTSTPGGRYEVQYSRDGQSWQASLPQIRAAANRTQWLDRGLPRTDRHPGLDASRFYRVALTP